LKEVNFHRVKFKMEYLFVQETTERRYIYARYAHDDLLREMTQEMQQLRKEIEKTKKHLDSLELRLTRMQKQTTRRKQRKTSESETERISKLQKEIHRKYPYPELDRKLLSLVGTLQSFR
jgi:phage shock protein A